MAAKEAGEIVRYEPAPEPMAGAVAIGALAVINAVFIGLFVYAMVLDFVSLRPWNSPKDQMLEAFWLAGALTTTAFLLAIYRRWFLPDLLVVKKRRKKFEDL
jgi:hypothetical protein